MTIGIDGNEANVDQQVGVSVYTTYLLHHFAQLSNSNVRFKIFLREKPLNFLPAPTENFKYTVIPSKFLWSQIFLPLYLHAHRNIDVFFTPAHYAPRFCPVPLVVTVHDLSYFYFPDEFLKKDLYKLTNWTKYSVKKAKEIIAVSKNTKNDLIKFYNLPPNKVEVIYNGFNRHSGATERSDRIVQGSYRSLRSLQDDKYILYVGTLQPRKNVQTLIRAFDKFSKKNPSFKLVLVGKKGWLYNEIFELVKELTLENKIVFTGHVSDSELSQLYRNAFCFVLPSLYEGFGIPVLEAMSNSCPVISSNSSSLPEVGGDAALYFDPRDENELLKNLELITKNEKLRKDLIEKGLQRIKQFSWTKSADKTLEVIKQAVL